METIDLQNNKTHRFIYENLKNYFKDNIDNVIKEINNTFNPLKAFLNLESVVANIKEFQIKEEHYPYLFPVLSFSPFLSSILRQNPDYYLNYLFENNRVNLLGDFEYYINEFKETSHNINDLDKFKREIRIFKKREFLRIGTQDICKIFNVEKIMAQLSDFASACLELSCEWLSSKVFKSVKIEDIFIFGMGKFGGRELNFSSDIDLIYFYIPETNQYIYKNFFETLTKIINEVTDEGFVFRVDLRLRPDGINGPIAINYEHALFYYENIGRFWERGALIKALPVAGNKNKGFELLKNLSKFIYRRSIDFSVSKQIAFMKSKIEESINLKEYKDNVKLGRGGIREIEFIIQTIQLIFGGKYPEIRIKNSLKFLKTILKDYDFLNKEDIKILIESYKFLRDLEHKIQILYEKQVHTLPSSKEELLLIAKYFGFTKIEDFLNYQERIREEVNRIFKDFFAYKEDFKQENKLVRLFLTNCEYDDIKSYFEKLRFEAPENVYKSLYIFFQTIPDDNKELIGSIFSVIFDNIENFHDKDNIIYDFIKLLEQLRYNRGYLHFINKNITVITFLMNIFSKSRYLSDILLKYKEAFDEIFFTDFFNKLKNREEIKQELENIVTNSFSYEDILENIKVYKHKENLRIGMNFLNKNVDLQNTLEQLSLLAEEIFKISVKIVFSIIIEKFGEINSKFAILGLGKFGSREMNFASDLDVILIFEKDAVSEKGINSQEYFSKFLQRIISFLTIRTYNGIVYEIDTRLRPSGNAGALVSSYEAFKEYHMKKSEMWEILVLLRAGFIAGNQEFGKKVLNFIKEIVMKRDLKEYDLSEILRIRKRIEVEQGKENSKVIDIKNGAGGLLDIEFLVQIFLLKNKLFKGNIFKAINLLYEKNVVKEEEKTFLLQRYTYLREIENFLRLTINKHTDKIDINNNILNFYEIVEIKKSIRHFFNEKIKKLQKEV